MTQKCIGTKMYIELRKPHMRRWSEHKPEKPVRNTLLKLELWGCR